MNDEVDTTGVHWFWLGTLRLAYTVASLPLIVPALPIGMIAVMGGYDGPSIPIVLMRWQNYIDRFAVWSWKKITGDKT